ncbi:MAG TPA: hypothetical protein VK498_00905 [Ferruginibacter sp.]|nr:hypothetical protein [Ferruginibacter sp.]
MKQLSFISSAFLLVLLSATLPGCEVIGGIFKAGVWVGVLVVVAIVGLVVWLIGKGRK